jgi:hypothetical protein
MIKLNYIDCKLISGGSVFNIYGDGSVSISGFNPKEILMVNHFQFTPHGIFDMQGNPLGEDITLNGYNVVPHYSMIDEMGIIDISEYRLTPV